MQVLVTAIIPVFNNIKTLRRSQGVRLANGEYITFIDSDDHITPDYIEKLVAAIEKDDCILAMCNAYDVKGDAVKAGEYDE